MKDGAHTEEEETDDDVDAEDDNDPDGDGNDEQDVGDNNVEEFVGEAAAKDEEKPGWSVLGAEDVSLTVSAAGGFVDELSD